MCRPVLTVVAENDRITGILNNTYIIFSPPKRDDSSSLGLQEYISFKFPTDQHSLK